MNVIARHCESEQKGSDAVSPLDASKGDLVKRGLTEQARNLVNKTSPATVEQFEKQYEHSMAVCKSAGHAPSHAAADQFIKDVVRTSSEPISCRAGCAFCCHQPVFASFNEFETLKNHLLDTGRKIERDRVQAQYDDINDGAYQKLEVAKRKCVFLGEDNCCTIYEVRPLNCRRLNVYSDPKSCYPGAPGPILYDVNPRTEAHLSAYFTVFGGDFLQEQLLASPELLK